MHMHKCTLDLSHQHVSASVLSVLPIEVNKSRTVSDMKLASTRLTLDIGRVRGTATVLRLVQLSLKRTPFTTGKPRMYFASSQGEGSLMVPQ